MTTLIVPDASVIVSWVFKAPDEPDAERALKLLEAWLGGRVDLLVPSLWVYELGNIIPRKNSGLAEEIMEILLDYRLPEQEMTAAICRIALDLMKRHGVTFHDAAYHAVAIHHRGMLVTADAAYLRAVDDRKHVTALRHFQAEKA